MIALDTSALISILRGEPTAEQCAHVLSRRPAMAMSAVTLAESLMVARGKEVEVELIELPGRLPIEIISIDAETPWRVSEIHRRWGKGNHPARLNFVDCFSYDVARQNDCPLLYIGNDFSQTDIRSALQPD